MPVQVRNDEMVGLLDTDFQKRYEPNFAWKSAVSALLMLPGLRAAWPMTSLDYQNPTCRDIAGGNYHLTIYNNPTWGVENLIPRVRFNGTNQYLDRADGGAANWADILGTEAWIEPADRGLTLGGWFYLGTVPVPASGYGLMSKDNNAGNQRSYHLIADNNPRARFMVSSTGAAVTALVSSGTNMVQDQWYFCAGRFTPSTEVKVWQNGVTNTSAAAVPAAIFDSTTAFEIGRYVAGNYLDGRASLCFLCAAAVSDSIMSAFYQQTRAMFGV